MLGQGVATQTKGGSVRIAVRQLLGAPAPDQIGSRSMNADPLDDLCLMVRSRYGALLIDTAEEDRAEALVGHAAATMGLTMLVWRRASGIHSPGASSGIYGTQDPRVALTHVMASDLPALYLFHGLGPDLQNAEVADLLREAARRGPFHREAIILTGADLVLAESLRGVVGLVHIPAPTRQEYEELLEHVLADVSSRMKVTVALSQQDRDRLLANLSGLMMSEAGRLLTTAIVERGVLDARDVLAVVEAKRDLVQRDGLLEYCAPQGVARQAPAVHG